MCLLTCSAWPESETARRQRLRIISLAPSTLFFSPPLAQTGVFSFSSFFLSLEAACLALFDWPSTLRCNFYNGLMGSGIHGFWSKPDRHPGMPDRLGQRPAYWTFSAFLPYDIDVPFLGCLTYSSNRSSSWPPSSALQLF